MLAGAPRRRPAARGGRRPAGLGRRRRLAPGRGRHRRGAAEGGVRPPGGGDRLRRRRGQGLRPLGRRRRSRRRRSPGCMREGLIERGGGHRMAAGLSLARDAARSPPWRGSPSCWPRQGADAEPPGAAAHRRADRPRRRHARARRAHRRRPAPSAPAAPAPRLARRRRAHRRDVRRVGESHLALTLADGAGGRLDASRLPRVRRARSAACWRRRVGAPVHLAGPAGARRLGRPPARQAPRRGRLAAPAAAVHVRRAPCTPKKPLDPPGDPTIQ